MPAPAASDDNDQYAAKKTWREARETIVEETKAVWTAGSVMEGRALDRGYCELQRSVIVLALNTPHRPHRELIANSSDCQRRQARR